MSSSNRLLPLFRMISPRELLDLLAMLRNFREPLTTPEGLRRAIDLLLKLGESFGLDPALLAKLGSIADDPHVFELALAMIRYAFSLLHQSQAQVASDSAAASAQSLTLTDWLALLMQLLQLLRRSRN